MQRNITLLYAAILIFLVHSNYAKVYAALCCFTLLYVALRCFMLFTLLFTVWLRCQILINLHNNVITLLQRKLRCIMHTLLKKSTLYPSHMSNIGLKCFSDQDLLICLDRFNIFVKFSKISELTITNFMKEINSTPGVYSIF